MRRREGDPAPKTDMKTIKVKERLQV